MPVLPPYYSKEFFNIIKKVISETPLNPIHMTLKQWYEYLLEEWVTHEVIDEEGRQLPRKCRIEQLLPDNDWNKSYHFSCLRGLSTQIRSFNSSQQKAQPTSTQQLPYLYTM